jgi:DNA-binding MarR family transcriptional regulator
MPERPFDPGSPYAYLTPPETDFWYSYMKVLLRVRYEMNHQLRAASGISVADYDVLVALTSEEGGRMRVSDLAVRIGWERSRLSHHVKRMRDRGLVASDRAADDHRATEVTLSAQGRRVLEEASPAHVAFLRSAFLDALSPRELTHLHESLDRVYDALVEHGSLPRPHDHP